MAEHKLPESHEYSISEKLASQNTTTIFLFLFFFLGKVKFYLGPLERIEVSLWPKKQSTSGTMRICFDILSLTFIKIVLRMWDFVFLSG